LKLLHIVATPRVQESNTLRISYSFVESLRTKHPDLIVDELNLFQRDLPAVAGENIETKYSLLVGQPIDRRHQESWAQIESLIEHFLTADVYLISAPMWNFGIPYALKFYIDAIVQPGYLFKYNERGQPVGLVLGKKMVCVTSRGGDYAEPSPLHAYDFTEPYLRTIFGFLGITDVTFLNAQPMDLSLDRREAEIDACITRAQQLVAQQEWCPVSVNGVLENPADLKPQVL
jgi:FMN-dependent NADH-azoreductase